MIPKIPEHHIEQEVAHIDGIAKLLDEGWTVTGIRIVEDPKVGSVGDVLTLFPDEQKKVIATLKAICAERRKDLVKQKVG